jgi:hypothetical protein
MKKTEVVTQGPFVPQDKLKRIDSAGFMSELPSYLRARKLRPPENLFPEAQVSVERIGLLRFE